MKLLCEAERLGGLTGARGILLSATDEWDFMTESPGDEGVFNSLIEKVEQIGASGYELMLTIGMIGLMFSIILTAITLLMPNSAQKKEEKKSHVLVICLAGVAIFSVFSIIGFFKSVGTGL
ncbi:MAG: hypothetical protein E7260_12860 [Lachnospiraceae bacterium]|nr:hypothetical protein [Lachnospiraceae bacterium]MBQ4559549.1 hypothetical protein [Tyzzerella sp.]